MSYRLNMPPTIEGWFWGNVDVKSADECWAWKGYVAPNGYGLAHSPVRYSVGARFCFQPHTLAYELYYGEPIAGDEPDHICHDPVVCKAGNECLHRRCCNPTHIVSATYVENRAPGRRNPSPGGRNHRR